MSSADRRGDDHPDAPRTVVGAIIVDSLDHPTRVVGARRSRPTEIAGRWEFPGGKLEPGESPAAGLRRELYEELGVEIVVGEELISAEGAGWPISAAMILRLYLCRTDDRLRPGPDHDRLRWLDRSELDDLDWLPADRAALPRVTRQLSGGD